MKQVIYFVLILILSITNISYAHQVKNSITRTTAFVYNDNQELSILYDLAVPSSELDLVYNTVDTDKNRIISDQEKIDFVSLIQDKIYINYDSKNYKPIKLEILTPYKLLEQVVVPTIEMRIDFGKVILNQSPKQFTVFNKLKFNTVLIQDWNISLDKNINVDIKNIEFYPDKTLISDQINAELSSSKGVNTPALLNIITSNKVFIQVKNFLRQPDYNPLMLILIILMSGLLGSLGGYRLRYGRTIIRSYLDKFGDTFNDSVLIGLSITISHTFVILILSITWALFKEGISVNTPMINLQILPLFKLLNLSTIISWNNNIIFIGLLIAGVLLTIKSILSYKNYRLAISTDQYANSKSLHQLPAQRLNLIQSIGFGIRNGFAPSLGGLILLTLVVSLGLGWIGVLALVVYSLCIWLSLIFCIKLKNLNPKQFSFGNRLALILPIIYSIAIIIIAIINII
jgi:ABC-type nickel/cobalt efflux system permease component RcnA